MHRYRRKYEERNEDLFNRSKILKNPDKKSMLDLVKEKPDTEVKIFRGILSGQDFYFWGEQNLLHEDVLQHMNLPKTSITIEIDFSEYPIEIRLSATNDRLNNISKLPAEKQRQIVMENPQIQKLFSSGMQKAYYI